jgi:hypothetical protein
MSVTDQENTKLAREKNPQAHGPDVIFVRIERRSDQQLNVRRDG